MRRTALKRPEEAGFLSLIPAPEPQDALTFVETIKAIARDAHGHAHHSRTLALDAVWFEHQGIPDRARQLRAASQADHLRACARLHRLARVCRDLVQWAAVDWMPTFDVQGSGLTGDELNLLCAVFGVPVDAILEDDRED